MSSVNKLACIARIAFIKYRAEPDIIMSNFYSFTVTSVYLVALHFLPLKGTLVAGFSKPGAPTST